MKALLAMLAVAATLGPAAALAQGGCDHARQKAAQISCADGQVWDTETRTCVIASS
jgi:hypothetical protein